MSGTFVQPGTQQPATVDYFSFEVGPILQPGEVQVTVYNSQGQQLGVLTPQGDSFDNYGYAISTFTGAASFSVPTVNEDPYGWDITDIRLGSVDTTYVAMGDSYSSGEGTYEFPWSTGQGTTCDTGPLAWPSLLANASGLAFDQTTMLACQNERATDLGYQINGQSVSEEGQLINLVSDDGPPDLVTMTIGGNDIGWIDVLEACFLGGTPLCLQAVSALDRELTEGSSSVIALLDQAYTEVADEAGGADGSAPGQVVVVGYPNLFPQGGGLGTALSVTYHCPWLRDPTSPWFISPDVDILLDEISGAQAALNGDMAEAAREAGVRFVAIPGSLLGHEMCTSFSYMNSLSVLGAIAMNRNMGHPNVFGQQQIANVVGQALGLIPLSDLNGADRPRAALPSVKLRRVRGPLHVTGRFHPGVRPGDTGPLSFAGGPLTDGTTGAQYIGYLTATGGSGADTWSITSGGLPPGLSLDSQSGTISGAPTASGDDTFMVRVTDASSPPQTASAPVTIDVDAPATLTVGAAAPPVATDGQPYTFQLPVTGGLGSVSWSVTSGSLPAGLTLDAATGQITGTPSGAAGASALTVQAMDSSSPAQVATASESMTVDAAADPLTVTTTSLPSIQAGQDYGAQLTSSGGAAPDFWSVAAGALPPGLSLDPASGLLTGTPTAAGTYDFTVEATRSTSPAPQTATQPLSITVSAAPPLAITTTGAFDGTEGAYYSSTFQATGGTGADNWTISSGRLPAGLALNAATGQVTGTPSGTGNATFDVTVSDSAGDTNSQAYSIDINQVPLTVSTALAPATAGTYYAQNVTPAGRSGALHLAARLREAAGRTHLRLLDWGDHRDADAERLLPAAGGGDRQLGPGPAGHRECHADRGGAAGLDGRQPHAWGDRRRGLRHRHRLRRRAGPLHLGGHVRNAPAWADPGPRERHGDRRAGHIRHVPGDVPGDRLQPHPSGGVGLDHVHDQGQAQTGHRARTTAAGRAGAELRRSGARQRGSPALHVEPVGQPAPRPVLQLQRRPHLRHTHRARVQPVHRYGHRLVIDPGDRDALLHAPGQPGRAAVGPHHRSGQRHQAAKYDQTLSAEGGTGSGTWALVKGAGSLPAGLKLKADGDITGVPTGFGTATFTVQVRDRATPNADVAKQVLSLDVEAAPPDDR
ncbi:MAG TPA: putative Ig domain-containing protein [Streptosporangiaceae bacterium]|jgi:lysophospholipase L1-like esterase